MLDTISIRYPSPDILDQIQARICLLISTWLTYKILWLKTTFHIYCVASCGHTVIVLVAIPTRRCVIGNLNLTFVTSYFSAGQVIDQNWMRFPCMVFATGFIMWAPSGAFESSCDLNMHSFPFDSQQCSLDFSNLVHVESMVRLYPNVDYMELGSFVQNKEFRWCTSTK